MPLDASIDFMTVIGVQYDDFCSCTPDSQDKNLIHPFWSTMVGGCECAAGDMRDALDTRDSAALGAGRLAQRIAP